jgi:hypothetical protein
VISRGTIFIIRRWKEKKREGKVRNDTIRAIMNVEKNILEVTEEKRLR